ncbi:hypothetical protein U3450_003900 [Bacillus cytotoxicus]|uniref:hypothetical protein n=1 Tax=unclassified Bacillus cereus group TaxID=2750818 RepID=UPI001F590D2D|nr:MULTISPECIES: hypothetical protein [unclassified Bacillus cereus group]EMA6344844.1 hypothetical protein [Bacillus cytotoxicus]
MSDKQKEKKPSESEIAKKSIAAQYKNKYSETPLIVSANLPKMTVGYAAVTKEHVELFTYDKTLKEAVSIGTHKFDSYASVSVDHFALKSVFEFKGTNESFTFVPTDKGKDIESLIRSNTTLEIIKLERKWYQKILGFRSGKKWKMVVACLGYLLILGTIVNMFSGKNDNSQQKANETIQTTSAAEQKQQEKEEQKQQEKEREELIKQAQEKEKTKAVAKEKTKETITVEFNEEGKKMALEQVKQNPLVHDAHIEVNGKTIVMAVIVGAAVNKEAAKEIGDNFVRNLGAFSGGKPPEKYYYGEIFDNYDLQIGVGTGPDNIIVQGAKVTSAKKITW